MENHKETKYAMVMGYLHDYIDHHHLHPGDKLPTEKQLVETLDVSRLTIQRALRELQQQGLVRRVQGDGTYINKAPTPAQDKSGLFIPVVLSNDSEQTGVVKYIQGADSYLSEKGCYLTVHYSHMNAAEEREVIQRLVEDGFRCIIVNPKSAAENYNFYFQLMQQGVEFVFIDRIPEHLVTNLVVCDNVGGGYLAAKHLLQAGARRIGFISVNPVETAYSLIQRKAGYLLALREAGITPLEGDIQFAQEDESMASVVERVLHLEDPLDALVCANDITALETLNYLQSIGVNVPEEMMLIGFDNLEMTENAAVPLSTIDQPFFRLGYEAAKIAKRILDEDNSLKVQEILPVDLVVRQSTVRASRHPQRA